MELFSSTNLILTTDSYKGSHFLQYPPDTTGLFSYIESRGGEFDKTLFFGLQMFLMKYLQHPIQPSDIAEAEQFFSLHGIPFNKKGWEHILKRHCGFIPVQIKAVPEGMKVPTGNVLVTIESTCSGCFWIVSYMETILLRAVWYPTTVATVSYHCKQILQSYMMDSCDDLSGLDYKLHDFGARGVSSSESAQIGGAAHLVNFRGSDTIEGILAANYFYDHPMAATSIPAAEHSTITCWGKNNEVEAYRNMLRRFAKPGSLVAVVSDSYDIFNACDSLWGIALKQEVIDSGATVIIRPDSGDPASTVVKCLNILGERFGYKTNQKGYKVLNHVRLIQGDGINCHSLSDICYCITNNGWSMDNVNFGMGGGLLQQINRDTCKFAMKCSAVKINDEWQDVYKESAEKASKRGRISLYQKGHGIQNLVTVKMDEIEKLPEEKRCHYAEILVPVYKNGKILHKYSLENIRSKRRFFPPCQ